MAATTTRTLTPKYLSIAINVLDAARGQWKMSSDEWATLVEAKRLLSYERHVSKATTNQEELWDSR